MTRRAAAWVAIGDELVDGVVAERNGDWLASRMAERGWSLESRRVVRDDLDAVRRAIRAALEYPGQVVTSGGLGPTPDDRTREAFADALGVDLVEDAAQRTRLETWARDRELDWHRGFERQCLRPRGSEAVDNPSGSAPALRGTEHGARWLALPGVPHEFRSCWDAAGDPWWPRSEARGRVAIYRFSGVGESTVARAVGDRFERDGWEVTILALPGEVALRIQGEGFDAAARESLERALGDALGPAWYGRDDDSLEGAVARRLTSAGRTLAIAESCTGGGLGARLTDVAGASRWFVGGHLVYSDALKRSATGVPSGILETDGAVSEAVALALAAGVRRECRADEGFSITGIAGPGGGSDAKPVGTVWFGWTGPEGTRAWRRRFPGDRREVRTRAVAFALDRLRRVPDDDSGAAAGPEAGGAPLGGRSRDRLH